MRAKVTLLLLFLNAVLFFFIFHFERDWRTERAATEVRQRVLGAEAADIRSLEVTAASGTSFGLQRRGENWFLTRPLEWPANPHAVSQMISGLQLLNQQTNFRVADLERNGQSLADYGLDHPRITIAFSSGTETAPVVTTLRLGDTTQVGNRLYLLSSDQTRIYVVDRSLADSFSLPLDQIRADSVVTIPVFEARSLTLQTGGAAGVRVGLRRDGGSWSFETPILSRADKDEVDRTLNGLSQLRVKAFVPNPPASPPSAAPALQVRIEGNNRSETLLIGEPAGRPAPGAAETDYYAQFKERDELRPAVFIVALRADLLGTLRNAQEELRERHILDFDPAAVTAITLAAPNRPELTLQRLESAAADGMSWEIVRRGAGGAQPQPADRGAVQRLLDQLAHFSAESFQSDAPQSADLENWGFNRPEREITLTLAGPPAAPGSAPGAPAKQTLWIGLPGQAEGLLAYARLASAPSSIYAVKPDILRETAVDPLAWRERLLRELPPSVAIVSLTLTDLASGQPVYRRALAAGETWDQALAAEPPDRRAALQGMLAGLRTLRAQRFILDSFSDQVNVGGEQRTWRYRLDLTLAEAAGAPSSVKTLWLTERVGGAWQYAGSKEFGSVFALEQPLVDDLWTLTYGSRDPGPPPDVPSTGSGQAPAKP